MAKPTLARHADELHRIFVERERIKNQIDQLQQDLALNELNEARLHSEISDWIRAEYPRILSQRKRSKR